MQHDRGCRQDARTENTGREVNKQQRGRKWWKYEPQENIINADKLNYVQM